MTRTEITCSSLARLWRMDERLFCKTFWVNEVGHAKQFLPKKSLMSEVLRLTLWQESSRRTPAASEKRFDKNSMFTENPTEIRFFLRLIDGLKVEKTELGQVK
uniref:Uncharacterized protein n=1 Tax=Populus trichocarpa TaxID=3694 RepID=A0A2K2AKD1_POPTR